MFPTVQVNKKLGVVELDKREFQNVLSFFTLLHNLNLFHYFSSMALNHFYCLTTECRKLNCSDFALLSSSTGFKRICHKLIYSDTKPLSQSQPDHAHVQVVNCFFLTRRRFSWKAVNPCFPKKPFWTWCNLRYSRAPAVPLTSPAFHSLGSPVTCTFLDPWPFYKLYREN